MTSDKQHKGIDNFEDLVPVTYFIRRGGLCYIESGPDAKVGGVHIATVKNERYGEIITELINDNFKR